MTKPLYDDPVVAEIHAIRAKLLDDCGGDHHKMMEQVRARETASARELISVPPAPMIARSTEQWVAHGAAGRVAFEIKTDCRGPVNPAVLLLLWNGRQERQLPVALTQQ